MEFNPRNPEHLLCWGLGRFTEEVVNGNPLALMASSVISILGLLFLMYQIDIGQNYILIIGLSVPTYLYSIIVIITLTREIIRHFKHRS